MEDWQTTESGGQRKGSTQKSSEESTQKSSEESTQKSSEGSTQRIGEESTRTMADVAYDRIKSWIMSLRYRPGEKLSETRLARDFGMGRSPLRSALARLEGEGWIRVRPQSGTFVRTFTARDARELAELRQLLEVYTARMAAERMEPEQLAALRVAFDELAELGAESHFDRFLKLDDAFHTAIHDALGNLRITEILRNLRDQIHWVRVTTAALPGRVDESLAEMNDCLRGLERKDGDAAAEAMHRHIGNIANSFASLPEQEIGAPWDGKPQGTAHEEAE